jgi:predicted polyphosphate/ATP-dependent NAD kinase
MVYRVMVGLGAVGVDRVLMMPATSGVWEGLRQHLMVKPGADGPLLPALDVLEMPLHHDARDTALAVDMMRERGASVLVVLGGDGTHRIVAQRSGETPICALSTGTNNAFPEMREATVAGIAAGLVATGRVKGSLRREKVLRVSVNAGRRNECALVDVAASRDRFLGARALWRPRDVSEVVVTSASPQATGFSALAGLLEPISRSEAAGLYVRLGAPPCPASTILVPLAPGLVVPAGVTATRRLRPGETVELERFDGCLALDGEREIEVTSRDQVTVSLGVDGPLTVDVEMAMHEAASRKLLRRDR